MVWSSIRAAADNAVWLAATTVQVVAWLYQLLAAAGLNLWLRTCGGIVVFSMVLLPGFLSVAWRLATEPESVLVHDLQYGPERRQFVDVFLPQRGTGAAKLREQKQEGGMGSRAPESSAGHGGGAPVVLFLAGGGWTIGYKYWGAGIGFRLAARGVLVVCADYRQFPQTNVSGMLEDVELALKWTVKNASRFGGDPRKVIIMGQSAGAHLATLYTFNSAAARASVAAPSATNQEAGAVEGGAASGPQLPAAVVALSGVYHMPSALAPFRRRGMTPSMVAGIFGSASEAALTQHSPLCAAQDLLEQLAASKLADQPRHAGQAEQQAGALGDQDEAPLYADVVASPASSPRPGKRAAAGTSAPPKRQPPSVSDTASGAKDPQFPAGDAGWGADEHDEAASARLASPPGRDGAAAWPSLSSLDEAESPAADPSAPAGERPLIAFLHGTDDAVAALSQAKELHATLTSAGWPSALGVYEAGTHTGPLIEDAMADGDYLLEDLTDICRHVSAQVSPEGAEPTVVHAPGSRGTVVAGKLRAGKPGCPAFGAHVEPRSRLSLPVCIAVAKAVNPF